VRLRLGGFVETFVEVRLDRVLTHDGGAAFR